MILCACSLAFLTRPTQGEGLELRANASCRSAETITLHYCAAMLRCFCYGATRCPGYLCLASHAPNEKSIRSLARCTMLPRALPSWRSKLNEEGSPMLDVVGGVV